MSSQRDVADDYPFAPVGPGMGNYRVLASVERRLEQPHLSSLKSRVKFGLEHFPELDAETVTVACRWDPDDPDHTRWNPYAEADPVNRIIRVPTHERVTTDTIFHELGHLAIEVLDERGEGVPTTSEEFCSIFSVARMPGYVIERETIAYLGRPTEPPANWPEICRRALAYREEHGASSHYVQRCREWLGSANGGEA